MKNIFLSYSHKDSYLADHIDILFDSAGVTIHRDIRDVKYKESIKSFMMTIRKMDYCIIIFSDNYLKSENCMYEILELIKDDLYVEKVIGIIKSDAKMFSSEERVNYIKFWENKFHELKIKTNDVQQLNSVSLVNTLKKI